MGAPKMNGSGAVRDDTFHFPAHGVVDISKSHIPLMIAVTVSLAISAGAFQAGKVLSRYEVERGEIMLRLDKIETKLDSFAGGLRKSRTNVKD